MFHRETKEVLERRRRRQAVSETFDRTVLRVPAVSLGTQFSRFTSVLREAKPSTWKGEMRSRSFIYVVVLLNTVTCKWLR